MTIDGRDLKEILGDKLAYPLDEVERVSGLGETSIFKFLKTGQLVGRKAGRRTIVLRDDLIAFLKDLPPARAKAA